MAGDILNPDQFFETVLWGSFTYPLIEMRDRTFRIQHSHGDISFGRRSAQLRFH